MSNMRYIYQTIDNLKNEILLKSDPIAMLTHIEATKGLINNILTNCEISNRELDLLEEICRSRVGEKK